MYSVGVDIGGTKVALAIVNAEGKAVDNEVISTDLSVLPTEMITKINESIQQLLDRSRISLEQLNGIGIGAPGPLDSKNGNITCPPNLQNWVDVPIVQIMKSHFSIPVALENDANAAALAEKWVGAARENDHFTYITISTGIGAGLVTEGKLIGGSRGNAGDIGHTVVDPSYGRCPCGQYGCLEHIASGTAIAKRGSEIAGKPLTTKQVFDLYNEGHTQIETYINDVFLKIGVVCVSIINTFDPEKIVIGGGVSKVGTPLFEAVKTYVGNYALNPNGRNTEIVPAALDQNAGVIGAAALHFDI